MTVVRDSGVTNGTPEPTTGLDGKTYPARNVDEVWDDVPAQPTQPPRDRLAVLVSSAMGALAVIRAHFGSGSHWGEHFHAQGDRLTRR